MKKHNPCGATAPHPPRHRRRTPAPRLGALLLLAAGAPVSAQPTPDATPTVITLPETVVSASRVPLPGEQVGSAVTVISGEDLERKQVRSVSDVLREVPGVAVTRSGNVGGLTQVRIRGAEGNHTLVIIDGIEMNDPSGASEYDLGNLLAADIERIEVLRGPQSALYGSDAIGGVINIVTRRGRGAPQATLRTELGTGQSRELAAALRGAGPQHRFAIGFTGLATGGNPVAPEERGNPESDGHRNQTVHLNLGVSPLPDLDLSFAGRAARTRTESDAQPAVAGIIRSVDADVATDSRQRSLRVQASYSLFEGAWEHTAGYSFNEDQADTFTNGARSFRTNGSHSRYDYQSTVFFETPTVAAASHTATVLFEREKDGQETASAFGGSNLSVDTDSVVGEYRLGLWDRLFLSASLRHDDNSLFADASTYRLTGAYRLGDRGTRLHASYGTGVKNPTLFELFGFGPSFVPNPGLRQETSRGWDAGVEQRLFGDRVVLDLTYFSNRIGDLITGAGNTAINAAGTSRVDGIELAARARLHERVLVTAQYTLTDAEAANGFELLRRPRHVASANLDYTLPGGRTQLDLGIDHHGEQRDIQFSNFFGSSRQIDLDGYTLVNVAASHEVAPGVRIHARVENLLDETYEEVFDFRSPGLSAFIGVRAVVDLF